MNYQEIYDRVVTITNRPDLTLETEMAIQSVTTRLHSLDFWRRDHVDQFVIFPSALGEQSFALSTLGRFRIFSYVRKWDPSGLNPSTNANTGWVGAEFAPVEPDKVIDSYGVFEDNKFYISGGKANFRSWTPFQHLLIGYYRLPVVSPTEVYSSWIAELWPYAIIYGAAGEVAGDVGNNEVAARMETKFNQQALLIAPNSLEALAR